MEEWKNIISNGNVRYWLEHGVYIRATGSGPRTWTEIGNQLSSDILGADLMDWRAHDLNEKQKTWFLFYVAHFFQLTSVFNYDLMEVEFIISVSINKVRYKEVTGFD